MTTTARIQHTSIGAARAFYALRRAGFDARSAHAMVSTVAPPILRSIVARHLCTA